MKIGKKILFLALLCLSATTSFYAQQKINIKIASIAPSRSPWDVEQRKLAEEWNRITKGQVNMQFYDTTALGGELSVIQKLRAVRPGQKSPLDGAIFTNIGIYELAPESGIFTMSVPFLFRNTDELNYVLDSLGPQMSKSVEDKGYKILAWFNVGWITFFSKDKVTSVADLKKVRMCAGGLDAAEINNAFKDAGYLIDEVPADRILTSLQSNSGLTGFYSIPMYAYATQYSKHVGYVLDMRVCPVMTALVVSQKVWDSIPEQYKPEMMEAVKKAENVFLLTERKQNDDYMSLMEKDGLNRVKVSAADAKKWESDFLADVPKMYKRPDSAINEKFFNQVEDMLTKYRSGKK
jgi:TRAP-type C4-dicarboxylate transport system substrate-binding protein